MRILLTGGGTGGHTFPLVATVRKIKELYPEEDLEVYFIGPDEKSTTILEDEGVKSYNVIAGKLRRGFSWTLPWDLFLAFIGFFHAAILVWWIMPDVTLAKGSYGSFWTALWSRVFLNNLIIHESDTIPGLANNLLGKISNRIGVAFPTTVDNFEEEKTAWIGNPLRGSLINWDEPKDTALDFFGFSEDSEKPIITVLGGSQGAKSINETLARAYPRLLNDYRVIHQCGEYHYEDYREKLEEVYGVDFDSGNIFLKGFLNEREYNAALHISDLVVSRSGAGAIFDIATVEKPSILIPYPYAAGNHQKKNAFFYAREGAAEVIQESNITPNLLLAEIDKVIDDSSMQSDMKNAASEFKKPQAAEKLAKETIRLGGINIK